MSFNFFFLLFLILTTIEEINFFFIDFIQYAHMCLCVCAGTSKRGFKIAKNSIKKEIKAPITTQYLTNK